MKWIGAVGIAVSMLVATFTTASACDQQRADQYDQRIRTAINARDNASLEKYAVLQAAVYHACAAENSGHVKTRYQLGEAASWDQAAQALNNESAGNLQKKRMYARNAMRIATRIASAASSDDKEKRAANAILWTLNWAHNS